MIGMNLALVRKGQDVPRFNRGVNLPKAGERKNFDARMRA
jgi:hypothetical protein